MKTLKTFRVVVLGTSGSGKTTLLASMYHQLAVQDRDVGFYLEMPEEQRKLLIEHFFQIANPELEWPSATREVTRWAFTCTHANSAMSIPVLSFSYLDFGGMMVDQMIDHGFELNKEVKNADSLLVLLDGHRLLRHMNGTDGCGPSSFFHELCHLLPLAMQAKLSTSCYFVITKWDLLEDRFTLEEIRDRLLEVDAFRCLVGLRRQQTQGLRLIPVSAVGKGFARLNGNGVMEKSLNAGRPKPFQVELPITYALIDGLRGARAGMPGDDPDNGAGKLLIRKWLRTALTSCGVAVRCVGASVGFPTLVGVIVPGLIRQLEAWLQKQEEELKRELNLKWQNIQDWRSAIEAILIAHVLIMKRFEERFPSSNLTLAA